MPYTRKQKNFARLCSSRKGRKKARKKCPPVKVAKEMAKAPVKKKSK